MPGPSFKDTVDFGSRDLHQYRSRPRPKEKMVTNLHLDKQTLHV
jgi:hypothetical protein